jgi:hypothetical protein
VLLWWDKLVTVNFFSSTRRRTRQMLTMIYMARIQNMLFSLLKVNNPSVRHPVSPPLGTPSSLVGPRRAPRLALRRAPVGSKKNNFYFYFFYVTSSKRGEKIFRFSIPKIPKIPEFPELRGLRGRSRKKKKVFSA